MNTCGAGVGKWVRVVSHKPTVTVVPWNIKPCQLSLLDVG